MFLQLLPKANGLAVTKLNSTKFSLYEIIWEMYEIVLFGGITDKMLSDFIIQSNFKWFPLDDEPMDHDTG